MIGIIFLLAFAISLLVIILFEFPLRRTILRRKRSMLIDSNWNLVFHLVPGVFLIIGLPLFVAETQIPIIIDMYPTPMFSLFPGIIYTLGMIVVNIVRFERFDLAERHAKGTYIEAEWIIVESDKISYGFQEALDYVENAEKIYKSVSVSGFLKYLSNRDDDVREIARQRMKELGIEIPEQD
ncbi:MAG: hypothetical protein GF411_09250 [Candidatus Lokiarchaeota archaeon]|nr:hypothetical protein [Candidatus Lokiarchaeota archaeon]